MNKLLAITGIALTGGAIYSVYKLMEAKRDSGKMQSRIVNPKILKFDTNLISGGAIFSTDVEIINSSKTAIRITKPTVFITSNGKSLVTSNPSAEQFTIEPLATTVIKSITMKVGWLKLLGQATNLIAIATGILANYKNNDANAVKQDIGKPIEMYYSTYINGVFFQSEPIKIM